MKSVIKGIINKPKLEYPCLKVFSGTIGEEELIRVVLFTAVNEGVEVYCSLGNYSIGDYSSEWNEYLFQPFDGTIELSN